MDELARLEARITSLAQLRDLFGALRALAASRVVESQAALAGVRSYVGVVEDAIAEGAGLFADPAALRPAPDAGPAARVVMCTEHGFVGGLNERLIARAGEDRAPGQQLIVVGRRGALLAGERNVRLAADFAMPTHVAGVLGAARAVADRLADAARVEVVFARHRPGQEAALESQSILPLAPELLTASAQRSPPLHHLAPATLLARLGEEYLLGEITRAIMESLTSENAARLRVMEAADRNIADKLDGFRRDKNTLRQAAVTSELLDVISGAEAIGEEG